MTVKQLYKILDEKIPKALSCEWDNDGLMCCPDADRQVSRVLLALDVTKEVVCAATEGGYDLIVSHHPFIFKGLKSLDEDNYISEKAIMLIKSGISVFSFHTRLDCVSGGVNDTLASLLGLENVTPFGEGDIGRIGELREPVGCFELAERLKKATCAEGVFAADGGVPCRRVAVLGGNGSDELYEAMASGADTYISGTLSYHGMTDAADMGINLIEGGHFYTENPVLAVLKQMIEDICADICCDVFFSNKIKLI